jgi:hypothetical protein
MKVTLQRTPGATYVNIEGDGYSLAVQTELGKPFELDELAHEARRTAAKFARRAERLEEAARILEDRK